MGVAVAREWPHLRQTRVGDARIGALKFLLLTEVGEEE